MQRLPSILCALLAAVHALTFLGAGPLDDEYIFYRYADNLLAGEGLVYQAGERVEACSSPLWLILIVAARAAGVPPVLATRVLGLLCAAGATYAIAEAWRARFASVPAGAPAWIARVPWPGLALALLPALAFHAAAGLGTVLVTLCLSAWCLAYMRDDARGRAGFGAAAWLGLACLARPEACLFLLPYLVVEAQRGRLARALPAAAPVLAWLAFRIAYYGRLTPITYSVKKLPLFVDLEYGAQYLLRATAETGFLAWLALAALWAWRRPVTLGRALWTATAGALLYALGVLWVGGDYLSLGRFVLPALPIALLSGSAALRGLFWRRPALFPAAVLGAVLALSWTQLAPRRDVFELYAVNERRWDAVGRELGARAAPGTSVASCVVGAIGYRSKLRIVDLLGRTNDVLWRVEPDLSIELKAHHRHDAAWALSEEPDVVLINGGREIEVGEKLVPFRWDVDVLQAAVGAGYRFYALPVDGSYPLRFLLRPGAAPPAGAVSLD